MKTSRKKKILIIFSLLFLKAIICFFVTGYFLNLRIVEIYNNNNSLLVNDRHGEVIAILANQKGYYAEYVSQIPPQLEKILLTKEDRYFRLHPGINPLSSLKALAYRLGIGNRKASSTITQQLVKVLLENEFDRTVSNKIKELAYVLAIETFQKKDKIIEMYVNSIYFGNQTQGIKTASNFYFGVNPDMLTGAQVIQLLATTNSPSTNNPAQTQNASYSLALASRLELTLPETEIISREEVLETTKLYQFASPSFFEIKEMITEAEIECNLTIDRRLQEEIRNIARQTIYDLQDKNVSHAAIIVLKMPENELLALVGTPNPFSFDAGHQINMANKPRAIGSTIKPFIYLKAFENELRPYTVVDDREYRYVTASGLPLYPKNFDYQYRGKVSLHYALSNSLNVPTLKTLEYVGLDNFYRLLEEDLEIKPIQKIETYQLGIALGNFELSLYELSRIFTVFSNKGILRNIKTSTCPSLNQTKEKVISDANYVQLVNKILNDRETGIDQFGFRSNLNLFQDNYALKTGTSRDFRDSWVIGYTPDFLVSVWIGNADLSPMNEVSGQLGAGKIWSEVMQLLFNSEYNKKTPFDFSLIKEFVGENGVFYGIPDDDVEYHQEILTKADETIILNPHDGDRFFFKENMKILLEARYESDWYVNNDLIAEKVKNASFFPVLPGVYTIEAKTGHNQETVSIMIVE